MAVCLLAAGANHGRTLIRHGLWWDYFGAHWTSAAYWTSLTVLDPLAALLLLVRPRLGIVATAALIATNVVHNLAVTAVRAPPGQFLVYAAHPMLLSQIAFLLFVAATAHVAWRA